MAFKNCAKAYRVSLFLVVCLSSTSALLAQKKSQNVVSASWIRKNITVNPVTASWLKVHLKKNRPRLLLTEKRARQLEKKIKHDKLIGTYYSYLHHYADKICTKPLLKMHLVGPRLPASGEAARRISILALAYRIGGNKKYLDRLNRTLYDVSNFSGWDSVQFLGVATMSYAIAIGVDWAGNSLPDSTIQSARSALRQHLLSSLKSKRGKKSNWWITAHNNWNQVCHSGLSTAALVIADQYPKLAATIIHRAVKDLPLELEEYSPDGAYPEGPSYWGYGTSFNIAANSFFESALGTDFNLSKAPGFIKSATYRMESVAPSGKSFNYSDASSGGLGLSTRGDLAWFAQKTGNGMYLNKKKYLALIHEAVKHKKAPPMFAPLQLIWLSEFKRKKSTKLPVYWKGEGYNPIAIFRAKSNEHTGFYLGVKGGSASVNHGNMDVGSFIFELNGVRWSIDPGTHNYHDLETNKHIGEALWDESQDSPRWSLLTKGNRFHSTLTVNGERHNVKGFAPITAFHTDSQPETVTLDLSSTFHYKNQLNKEIRTFRKINGKTLQIEDDFTPSDSTKKVTWQMMTRAAVTTTPHGAILKQDGKKLLLKIIRPDSLNVSVVSLNPPPLSYDKKIKSLKRIDITIPYYMLGHKQQKLIVQLEGD